MKVTDFNDLVPSTDGVYSFNFTMPDTEELDWWLTYRDSDGTLRTFEDTLPLNVAPLLKAGISVTYTQAAKDATTSGQIAVWIEYFEDGESVAKPVQIQVNERDSLSYTTAVNGAMWTYSTTVTPGTKYTVNGSDANYFDSADVTTPVDSSSSSGGGCDAGFGMGSLILAAAASLFAVRKSGRR
jgi:hypothetical protein